MIDNICLIVPEDIVKEVEYIVSSNDLLKNINVISIPYTNLLEQNFDCVNCSLIQESLESSECFYKALLIHGFEFPQIVKSPECNITLHTHGMENLYELMLSARELQEHKGKLIISSGWLDKIISNTENDEQEKERVRKYIDTSYSSILHIETGFYESSSSNIKKLSEITGKSFKTVSIDMDLMKVQLKSIVLEHDCISKAENLKESNERIASYSMSIEIIKELVELKTEEDVIEKIAQTCHVLFAPEKVSYISLRKGLVQSQISIMSDSNADLNKELLETDKMYLIFNNRDGFILKIADSNEIMGTIEVQKVFSPQKISEYLNTALIIAKASSLVVSNIRRYEELSESKKQQRELADMLMVMNKILRHDIANNLNVEINAIELYNLKKEDRFLKMAQDCAHRSAKTIENMKDIEESLFSDERDLLPYHVRNTIESTCSHFDILSNIEGDALIMADSALPSTIENIVRNAQVHGKADDVQIFIEDDETKCTINIQDNGIGIPEEIKTRIFDEGVKYGDTGNTGLGLYIVKKTIERYKGTVSVKNNEPKGATFVIELPSIHIM